MMSTTNYAQRSRAFERRIARLEKRILPLQRSSNRVSWVRAGVFVAGVILALAVGAADGTAGWFVFGIAMFVFAIVVVYHRRLEHWIAVYSMTRKLNADQRARMDLDWEKLPAPVSVRAANTLALDLDLNGPRSLHHLLDTTRMRPASQLLADWLMQSHPVVEEVLARQHLVRELTSLHRFRERFQLTLRLVMQEPMEGDKMLEWLTLPFPSRRLKWTLLAATLLVVANWVLIALSLWAGAPAYWVIGVSFYAAFYFLNQLSLNTVFNTLLRLDAELDRFGTMLRYLESVSYRGRDQLTRLCAPFINPQDAPSALVRKIKLATAAVGLRSNIVLGLALNLILPWDFFFAVLADRYRAQAAKRFPEWLAVCYQLDALIALANFATVNGEYAFPEISPDVQPVLHAEVLGHPLIHYEHKVCNDFTVPAAGEIEIITGSNMAGKSTFLKTIGVNLCLAYAGAPVNARSFHSVPFRLYTCIHITDSIVDGFSYFYAEVKCLKRLLDELKSTNAQPLLYLVDEIFRGTNNRERLVGSRAYIQSCLGANGAGLIATHDLELANLAQKHPEVRNYHFRDDVRDGRLVFDYRLHLGPCPTTNALRIMQMEGLPVESDG